MLKKLFISDMHIGDGSAKDDFEYDTELCGLIDDFSQESDVELIIVGDGIEILESRVVKNLGMVPFFELMKKISPDVIDDIFEKHPAVFDSFRRFSKKHKIVYVVGNHDYYLLANKKIKESLLSRFENIEVVPYYYDPDSGILAVHGNQFDVVNKFTFDKKTGSLVPPLGDYISRYMMFNFDEYIQEMVPRELMRDYDNVRPILDVFHWFNRAVDIYDLSVNLLEIWTSTFIQMMRSAEAKFWMKKNFPVSRFMSKVFLNRVGGIKLGQVLVRIIMMLRTMRKTDYLYKVAKDILKNKKAITENDLLGYCNGEKIEVGKVFGVVFGHIHHSCFRIVPHDGEKKFYINCGSWRPVVEKVNGKKKYGFQRKAELFYAVVKHSLKSDIEIVTNTTSKIVQNGFL